MTKQPKITVYTMEGCGYCTEQKKTLQNYSNKKIISCTRNSDNETCKKLNAFPTIKINDNFYQGFHNMNEIKKLF